MELQDKVIMNVIKYMKEFNIDETYILEHSTLKAKRLNVILTIGTKRRITLSEIYEISKAIEIPMKVLFK